MCKKKAQNLRRTAVLTAPMLRICPGAAVSCMFFHSFSRKNSGIVIVTMRNLVYNIREYIHYYVCTVKKTVSCNTNP